MLKLYTHAQARLNALRTDESGNAAEYGLIIAIVALGIVIGLGALALALNNMFTDVSTQLGTP
jgi:Flp pilus assembly pilin Flp